MSKIGVREEPDSLSYTFYFRSPDFCPGSKLIIAKREITGSRLILTLEEEVEARVVGSSRVERVPFIIVDKDVLDVTGGMHARSHKKSW